jgi:hypothetical protein
MSESSPSPKLLYCRCAYAQVVPQSVKDGVLAKLCDSGAGFESVADLCEMAAHRDERLKAFADSTPIRIAACFPRVVRGLFRQAECPLPEDGVEVLNMRVQSIDEVSEAMLKA